MLLIITFESYEHQCSVYLILSIHLFTWSKLTHKDKTFSCSVKDQHCNTG